MACRYQAGPRLSSRAGWEGRPSIRGRAWRNDLSATRDCIIPVAIWRYLFLYRLIHPWVVLLRCAAVGDDRLKLTAIDSGDVHRVCPGCGTSRAIDLRTLDRHPLASVDTLVHGLRCSWCPGSRSMPNRLRRHSQAELGGGFSFRDRLASAGAIRGCGSVGLAPSIVVEAFHFEPVDAVAIERRLPSHEFVRGKAVAIAGLVER
jgi:hypothetical protein